MAVTSRSALPPLLAAVLVLGIGDSMVGPYLVLYGVDEVGLSPLRTGVFISLIAVSGLAVSTWLGRRYDRSASRRPAFAAILLPAAGYAVLTTTTGCPQLLLIGAGLLGAGLAAFPQLFTLARTHLDRAGPAAARRGTPALRSTWSVAWSLGPIAGAALLAAGGYTPLMLAAALCFALVSLPLLLLGPTPEPHGGPRPDGGLEMRPMVPAAVGFTLFHTALMCGSVVLPLYVTRTLQQPDSSVGLLFSVCALVEIPAGLATMLLPAESRTRWLIVLGMLLLGGYFVLVAVSSGMPLLIGSQVARGVSIAVVAALGITYVQDLAPHATGRATTLFANTFTTGSLISGVLAGATAQAFGFRPALLICAALALLGGVLLLLPPELFARRSRPATLGH